MEEGLGSPRRSVQRPDVVRAEFSVRSENNEPFLKLGVFLLGFVPVDPRILHFFVGIAAAPHVLALVYIFVVAAFELPFDLFRLYDAILSDFRMIYVGSVNFVFISSFLAFELIIALAIVKVVQFLVINAVSELEFLELSFSLVVRRMVGDLDVSEHLVFV